MKIEEIVKKSKEICEGQQGCIKCPLRDTACVDKHGHVNASDASKLVALEEYLESQLKNEKKGKAKK